MSKRQPTRILLSQGRIADRTSGAIPGAAALAAALARACGLPVSTVGTPEPDRNDNWDAALRGADPTLHALAEATDGILASGARALIVANTCSASLATLPVAARHNPGMAVLWIDAHGDYNIPQTTGSGYLGGMALAGASGLWDSGHGIGVEPARTLLVGVRDIDPAEQALIADYGAATLAPSEVTPERVTEWLAGRPVWIHIDWDVMEPGLIPAAYAVPGGLLPAQLKAVLTAIPARQIVGVELAELELPQNRIRADGAISLILDIVAPLTAPSP